MNPATPVSAISEVLPVVDVVLVMTVNPGFAGQQLIPQCLHKISELATLRSELGLEFSIEVDGGIKTTNAEQVRARGADVLVSGTGITQAGRSRANAISQLKG